MARPALLVVFVGNRRPGVQHVRRGLVALRADSPLNDLGMVAISANDPRNRPEDAPELPAERHPSPGCCLKAPG